MALSLITSDLTSGDRIYWSGQVVEIISTPTLSTSHADGRTYHCTGIVISGCPSGIKTGREIDVQGNDRRAWGIVELARP